MSSRLTRAARFAAGAALAAALVAVTAGAASAHPLGNFTVNTASGLRVGPDSLVVDQVVDFAELPTFQERSGIDTDADGTLSGAERSAWAAARCGALAAATDAKLDGARLSFGATTSSAVTAPGGAGLDVLRLECRLEAALPAPAGAGATAARTLTWRTTAYADRVGWHEITAAGDGTTLRASDVPEASPSARLTAYPTDLLTSPVVQRQATISFTPGGARLADTDGSAGAARAGGPVDRAVATLTGLLGRQSGGPAVALLAVGLAVALGAAHAFAPGHGKTLMAAYLVGQRGTLRDAALIGGTVTITHTAGVLSLGLLLATTRALAAEQLYPWLGAASGLLLAGLGVSVLRRTLKSRGHTHGHDHGHAHGHDHGQGHARRHEHDDAQGHEHGHGQDHRHSDDHGHHDDHHHGHSHGGWAGQSGLGRPRPRDLVALGFAGGLSPSPSALLVLLGAAALGKAWLGALLVLAYGVGMALTLTAAGLLLVRARGLAGRLRGRPMPGWLSPARRLAPAGTATLIVLGGLGLAARSLVQL